MIICVQWNIDSRENKLDDHESRRPKLVSNFFEGVYIALNTSDHCLSVLEHDHTARNMSKSLIVVVLNVLLLVSCISD